MAKVKSFAVEVEITIKTTLFVEARRPNGAAEKVLSEDGWREACRYTDSDTYDLMFLRRNAQVTRVREVA